MMADDERERWLAQERYFARSWTHIFYLWKLTQVTLGRTVRDVLTRRSGAVVRVLDLGCGPGHTLFDLSALCADLSSVRWYGVDLNPREVAEAAGRSRFRVDERKMPPVRFAVGNIAHVPVPDASIDLLVSTEVVEHLPDPRPALAEMARILKPGGHALITTPNPGNAVERLGFALNSITGGAIKRLYWRGYDSISAPVLTAEVGYGHVSVHGYPVWREWLRAVGLPVVRKVRGPAVFGSPFFDRHPFLMGCVIALDPLLDRLPGRFLLSTSLGMLCRKD